MRDMVQERLQHWSYADTRRQALTRTCASKLVYPLYAGVAVCAVRPGTRLSGAELLRQMGSVLLAKLLAKALHRFVIRPRPFTVTGVPPLLDVEPDNGFPSDHALQIGVLLASVWTLAPRLLPLYLLSGVLTLGARLGAGVHHTGDVLAGMGLIAATEAGVRALPLPAAWETPLRERVPAWCARLAGRLAGTPRSWFSVNLKDARVVEYAPAGKGTGDESIAR